MNIGSGCYNCTDILIIFLLPVFTPVSTFPSQCRKEEGGIKNSYNDGENEQIQVTRGRIML